MTQFMANAIAHNKMNRKTTDGKWESPTSLKTTRLCNNNHSPSTMTSQENLKLNMNDERQHLCHMPGALPRQAMYTAEFH